MQNPFGLGGDSAREDRPRSFFSRQRGDKGTTVYALRKQIPEPVFGIIKSVMGFRQFLLRGIDGVRGEWSLVTMSWNPTETGCPADKYDRSGDRLGPTKDQLRPFGNAS